MNTKTLKSSAESKVLQNFHDDGSYSITKEFVQKSQLQREVHFISRLDCAIKHSKLRHKSIIFPFLKSLEFELYKPLSEVRACDIMLQLCTILAELQNKKIIHRDIKPSNLFFSLNGTLLLNDFETAVESGGPASKTGERTCGTPAYMPPEQFSHSKIDCRADQYAVGTIFFQMLSGTMPFRENKLRELHTAKKNHIRNPSDINPKLSQSSCEICARMMSPDKTKRFNCISDIIIQIKKTASALQQKTQILEAPIIKIPTIQRKSKKKLPPLFFGIAVLLVYIIYYSNN